VSAVAETSPAHSPSRASDDAALVFVAGHPAIHARKIRYYQDLEFRTRSEPLAPKESDRLEHDWSHWTSRAIPRVLPAVSAGGRLRHL
jgi:type IV secretory pathway TraG/TraD family ATPase VirD4